MKSMLILSLFFSLPAAAIDLNQAVQSTLQKNESVGQSRAQLSQMQEQVDQAKSAIFPTLSLNASYLIQPPVNDPLAAEFFPERQATANLSLTQPLFRGFREFAALRRQKDLLTAQEQTHLSQMILLYQQAVESFLQVLSIEQDLRNVDAQRVIYQGRIKDLQGRAHRGESSATETLTAQSTAASLEADFQMQTAKLRSARENFAYITGLPVDTPLDETSASTTDVSNLKPLPEYLARIEERPDVRIAKSQYAAADEEVSIAKGGHWPSLDVVGNYYLERPDGYTKDLKWDVQFRFSMPLFEGGLRQSQVRQSASKKAETDLALQQLRRKSESEIRSLHDSLRVRSDQLKALKLSSDLAEKNYQLLLRDSRRGLVRSIDVQLGLTEYRVAKRSFDQARYEALLERIRLDLAAAIVPDILTKEL